MLKCSKVEDVNTGLRLTLLAKNKVEQNKALYSRYQDSEYRHG